MTDLAERLAQALRAADHPARPIDVLATALCVPPVVTWPHLRSVRRALLGEGSLEAEVALAGSELVESTTRRSFAMHRNFVAQRRRLLRSALDDLPGLLELPLLPPVGALTPLLDIESQLAHLYVTTTDFEPACDAILRDVVLSLTSESRRGIRDWTVGAVARLPPEVIATSSGYLLCSVCGLPSPVQGARQLPIDLALARQLADALPRRLIALSRDGTTLELGPPSYRRAHAVQVPSLPGVPLTVSWEDDEGLHEHALDLTQLPTRVPTGGAEVTVTDVLGTTFVLEAFEADRPPEAVRLEHDLDVAVAAQESGTFVPVEILRRSPSGYVVKLLTAPSLSAHVSLGSLNAVPGWLQDPEPEVRVSVVQRDTRAVIAVAARTRASTAGALESLSVGDVVEGEVRSVVKFGVFVTLDNGISGLLHTSQLATNILPMVGTRLRVRVTGIDIDRGRVAFGSFPSRAELRERQVAEYPVGRTFRGRVQNIVNFGFFVGATTDVANEFGMLLHNTEIPADVRAAPGTLLDVVVMGNDGDRVSLAMVPRVSPGAPTRTTGSSDEVNGPTWEPPDGAGEGAPAPLGADELDAVASILLDGIDASGGVLRGQEASILVRHAFPQLALYLNGFGFLRFIEQFVPEVIVHRDDSGGTLGRR